MLYGDVRNMLMMWEEMGIDVMVDKGTVMSVIPFSHQGRR